MELNNRFIKMAGLKFGRLTVIEFSHRHKTETKWRCICECGNETVTCGNSLRRGRTRSCGCLLRETCRNKGLSLRTHGAGKTPEYRAWSGMKNRCDSAKADRYRAYHARGITVCRRWRHSFENFLADMGQRPSPKHSIDRINNDRGYSPSNCRWATVEQQMRNRRDTVLNEKLVLKIRKLMAKNFKYSEIATKLEVSKSAVRSVCRGETWKDINL